MTDEPIAYSGEVGTPRAVAIVVLPFTTAESAVTFANLVRGKDTGQTAIVTAGSCYEWMTGFEDEGGQVIEFEGNWEPYTDPQRPDVTIMMRENRPNA